ncbi:hypothetical protein IJH01_00195 [Candidatus Saccharibacteria bacterium]|nr:hypothetical protein [Candidatus Saccharibacteria bacterium]
MNKNEIKPIIITSGGVLGLPLLAGVVAMQPNTSAVSSSVNASVKVASACSITGGSNN